MRFITWNMGKAFEQRCRDSHDRSWKTLLGLNPDVAFVQESRRPSPDLVARDALLRLYPYPTARDECYWRPEGPEVEVHTNR
jgi:endonuclease/exonuclease/phosphatase family metal-dependent hydrolase